MLVEIGKVIILVLLADPDAIGIVLENRHPSAHHGSPKHERRALGPPFSQTPCTAGRRYAALRLASISFRLIRHSAICTALSAAPLRRLSDTHQSASPFSTVGSSRMRLT